MNTSTPWNLKKTRTLSPKNDLTFIQIFLTVLSVYKEGTYLKLVGNLKEQVEKANSK